MAQATNTIYGDLVTTETLNAIKRKKTNTRYGMSYLYDVSKFAKKGLKTIHVPYITTESGQVVAVGGEFVAPSGSTSGSKDLTVDQKVGNPFLVQRDLDAQTTVKTLKEKSADGANNILEKEDINILTALIGAIPAGAKLDFAGHATTANKITIDDFIAARLKLNKAKAPTDKRFCFIGPDHESQLYKIDQFISADKIGQQSKMPIPNGFIGRLLGFDVILLNHIPQVDKAGAINSTAAKNDSTPVIFGHEYCFMFGNQLMETLSSTNDLATSDRYVPYRTFGRAKLEDTWVYQISDKTTADPS